MNEIVLGLVIAILWFTMMVLIVAFSRGARSASENLKDRENYEDSN